jgi:hypothetical protein
LGSFSSWTRLTELFSKIATQATKLFEESAAAARARGGRVEWEIGLEPTSILDQNPLPYVMGHARGEGRDQNERGGPFIECIQWRDFRCTMVLTGRITAV